MTDLPGPELDRKISLIRYGEWDESRCRICGWTLGENSMCFKGDCSLRPPPETRADTPATYSLDFRIAWILFEKMLADGRVQVLACRDGEWQVGWVDYDYHGWGVVEAMSVDIDASKGVSAAHAICLAYLDIYGEES